MDWPAVRVPGGGAVAADNCDLIDSLERQWRDSLCAKDIERLRSLIHPRFTLIGTRSTGPFTLSREEWLEAVQKRELVTIDLDIKEAVVLKDVMVGTVEARWRVSYLGREIEDCVLLTDVWVHEDGRWQVVRRHSSPMPAPDRRISTSL
jgi:ketosteroid isomerase-like protein